MNIGANIHRLRSERAISQGELAKAIDVHQTHISKIERGDKMPSIQVATQIAEFFGVTLAELFGESAAAEVA